MHFKEIHLMFNWDIVIHHKSLDHYESKEGYIYEHPISLRQFLQILIISGPSSQLP